MPSSHEDIYDFLAEAFRSQDRPQVDYGYMMDLAEKEGHLDVFEIPKGAMANAMKVRGVKVVDGLFQYPSVDGLTFDPAEEGYDPFLKAAKKAVGNAEYPLPTDELLQRCGAHSSAAPLTLLKHHLKRVGVHWLPGVGYWRAPQYTNKSGRIVSKRLKSERTQAMIDAFEKNGWPLSGKDIEKHTGGIATTKYISNYVKRAGEALVASIGYGLYVPADLKGTSTIPMSANVADLVRGIDVEQIIDDKEDHQVYRIMLLASKFGYVKLKKSRTTRSGVRCQTIRIKWTQKGRDFMKEASKRTSDEF